MKTKRDDPVGTVNRLGYLHCLDCAVVNNDPEAEMVTMHALALDGEPCDGCGAPVGGDR